MIDACQEWSERSRLKINDDKTKIMVFYESLAQRASRHPSLFWLTPRFPLNNPPNPLPLEEPKEFTYLGLKLDPQMTMQSDGTHLPKDQLGLPNSLCDCAQSQTRHPSQFTRYTDKPTNSVAHLAVMRPFTCNPKPQIPSPPHPGATSPKCSNKLSPAHLALLNGSADHHA